MLGISDETVSAFWMAMVHVGVVAIAAYSADWDHFTWWFQATFTVYAILGVVGVEVYYFFFFQSLQLQIISAVLLMSLANCEVFEEAYSNLKPETYLGGDFSMHYLPGVLSLALCRDSKIILSDRTVTTQIWLAPGLFLTWQFFHAPWEVYGCNLPQSIVVFLPLVLTVIFNLAVLRLLSAIRTRRHRGSDPPEKEHRR